jgi:hypothetical protein
MKKFIVFAFVAVVSLASCTKSSPLDLGYSDSEREILFDFIHYCQDNEGLEQHTIRPGKAASDALLRKIARYYGGQFQFADVTDFEEQSKVDALIYND